MGGQQGLACDTGKSGKGWEWESLNMWIGGEGDAWPGDKFEEGRMKSGRGLQILNR